MNIQYTRIYIHLHIYIYTCIYIYTYVYNLYIYIYTAYKREIHRNMHLNEDSTSLLKGLAPETQTWLERSPKEIVPNFPHHSTWLPMISWLVSFRPPESLPLGIPREKSHGYWVGHPKNILLIVAEPSKIALSTGFCRNYTGIIRDDCNP